MRDSPVAARSRPSEDRHLALRPATWAAVLRQSLPVVGVFVYGWPMVQASVLFLTELWLAMTLHDALDATFDRRGRRRTWSPAADRQDRTLAANLAHSGLLYGLVMGVGVFGHLAVGFPKGEWGAFLDSGWRSGPFLASLVALLSSHVWDAIRHRQHLEDRTEREALEDDVAAQFRRARLILIVLGTLVVPVPSAFGYGAHALVVVIALVNLAMELFTVPVGRKLGVLP